MGRREMAHLIHLEKLYHNLQLKNFPFFVSDYLKLNCVDEAFKKSTDATFKFSSFQGLSTVNFCFLFFIFFSKTFNLWLCSHCIRQSKIVSLRKNKY